jgi:hypothetical protein
MGDGPPKVELNVDIGNDVVLLNKKKCSIADLKKLFETKPDKKWGYAIRVSCSKKKNLWRIFGIFEFLSKIQTRISTVECDK